MGLRTFDKEGLCELMEILVNAAKNADEDKSTFKVTYGIGSRELPPKPGSYWVRYEETGERTIDIRLNVEKDKWD